MVHLVEQILNLKLPSVKDMVKAQLKVLTDKYFAIFKINSSAYEYLNQKF
jgi:hypothetical protein